MLHGATLACSPMWTRMAPSSAREGVCLSPYLFSWVPYENFHDATPVNVYLGRRGVEVDGVHPRGESRAIGERLRENGMIPGPDRASAARQDATLSFGNLLAENRRSLINDDQRPVPTSMGPSDTRVMKRSRDSSSADECARKKSNSDDSDDNLNDQDYQQHVPRGQPNGAVPDRNRKLRPRRTRNIGKIPERSRR